MRFTRGRVYLVLPCVIGYDACRNTFKCYFLGRAFNGLRGFRSRETTPTYWTTNSSIPQVPRKRLLKHYNVIKLVIIVSASIGACCSVRSLTYLLICRRWAIYLYTTLLLSLDSPFYTGVVWVCCFFMGSGCDLQQTDIMRELSFKKIKWRAKASQKLKK